MLKTIKNIPFVETVFRGLKLDLIYHFAWALLAALWYGFPARRIKIIGITGTKGKTSTAVLTASLLESAGKKVALLSSSQIKMPGRAAEANRSSNSMPGRGFIQKFLRDAGRAGAEYAVIEVTSQGVLFSRHRFIRWSAAGITNIAPEHIEAHGSFESYRAAKMAFLRAAADQGATVFVNQEDEPSAFFGQHLPVTRTVFYSSQNLAELPERTKEILPGAFNRRNITLAFNILRHFGIPEEVLALGIEKFEGVPGRAEFIQKKPFAVIVDYAHTAESLKAIYEAAREIGAKRIIGVLGAAGGGRDKWKRPAMGRVAAAYCADIMLTDEDPYDEAPGDILRQIAEGFSPNTVFSQIMDRGEAIQEAIRRAGPGDAVIITGKGSEQSIHLARGKTIPWSDRRAAEEALKK
jgi:UDP-N-acetylmuramoyl-L-alanyl-D-glutamate--2,6-diaminopimelate ligase